MIDVLGNEFRVGDDVAYAAQTMGATLVVGKVREIHDGKLVVVPTKRSGTYGNTGRAVSIRPDNVVILRSLTLKPALVEELPMSVDRI